MPSLLETLSFITGLICVWLTVRQNIWNFPIGLLNVATFCVVFFESKLYADAGLQIVYFVLGVMGWYWWLYGGEGHQELKVTRTSGREMAAVIAAGIVLTVIFWQLLSQIGGSASFFDALTTSISLCAQWLLNRKLLENWLFWIVADIIYIPLYVYKELYLTAALYALFLVLAVMGLLKWRESMNAEMEVAA
ncbi:MAG: nicotinamide riboside transporter PnuC [Pyrinomonadaceae bacterium]